MPILTSFMNTISGNTPTADETSDNDTTMSTNVSNPTYIPSGENFLYTIFKDTKVSYYSCFYLRGYFFYSRKG